MILTEKKRKRLKNLGLHYCKYYKNIVRYNDKFCRECPHNTTN